MSPHEKPIICPTLDDVLNAFVCSSECPSQGTLEIWIRHYPQYRQELLSFAAAWARHLIAGLVKVCRFSERSDDAAAGPFAQRSIPAAE